MSATSGMSKHMSLPKARAPGELKSRDELHAVQHACIAVANVSSITAWASCSNLGSRVSTTALNT